MSDKQTASSSLREASVKPGLHDAHVVAYHHHAIHRRALGDILGQEARQLFGAPSIQSSSDWDTRAALLDELSATQTRATEEDSLPKALTISELEARRQASSSSAAAIATIRSRLRAHDAPAEQVPTLDVSLLVTRAELIEAYGSRGLCMDWFKRLKDRPWLKTARKSKGSGRRGHIVEPMFCPYEVMQGMVHKLKRERVPAFVGWHLLEQHFPRVYELHEAERPRRH